MKIEPMNPVMPMVVEVHETRSVKEVAEILATNKWVVISAAMDGNGETCLFALGRIMGPRGRTIT